ncbi:MAG: DNA repair exonuclease, partial [Proteobacteria bacterium]|nr:DNA repair exonuclease [Pseudomonadota bacterium]
MAYRFVHTADLHLDSPLRSLALRDDALASLIGGATRDALRRIVDLCLEERVDALFIAGDLYDGDQTSMKTARFLVEQLGRLNGAGIRVFIIRGNHDAMSKITRELTLPASVKVFGSKAEAITIERGPGQIPVAVHGLSFRDPMAPQSLLAQYRPPVQGAINIGLLHTSLGGSRGHDVYAPSSPAELSGTGFRYWALGHIHKRSVIEGACTIVMPGIPQGRDINEAGPKSASLVSIADDGTVRVEERFTALAEFARLSVDLAGVADQRGVLDAVERTLIQARNAMKADHLVTRIELTGETPLAYGLRADADLYENDIAARAGQLGNCWIDSMTIACLQPGEQQGEAGAANELARLIRQDAHHSESYRVEIARIAA